MEPASIIRRARRQSGLSLRGLAERAGTSHSTLAAYEAGRKIPSLATLERVVRAAGFELTLGIRPRPGGGDPAARGRELEDVLLLAAEFPARERPALLEPVFGRR